MKPLYRELLIYVIAATIAFLLLAGTLRAADLAWDHDPEQYGLSDGYRVYFSTDESDHCAAYPDGLCVYPLLKDEVEIEGETEYLRDVENKLNLHPGVTYTFRILRWNEVAESDLSNETLYTRPSVGLGEKRLPPPVSPSPSGAGNLRID